MKTKALGAAIGLALGMAATSASALSLYASPSLNYFEDDNIDYLSFDADGDGSLDVGDRLTALVDFNKLAEFTSTGAPTGNFQDLNEFTGITEIEVTSLTATGNPNQFRIEFGPSASFEATYGTGAMLALYNDVGGNLNVSTNCLSVAGCQAEATDGSLWAVFGLDSDVDTEWFAIGNPNVGALDTAAATTKVAAANFALNVIANYTTYDFLNVACDPLAGLACAGDKLVALSGSADIIGGAGLDENHLRSDSDILVRVSPVPEPGSVALLGLGLTGLALARRRKQK